MKVSGKAISLAPLRGSLLDQRDGLVDGRIEIEKDRRRLNHRHLVFLMNQTHRIVPFALKADNRWVASLQPWQRAPLVCSGTKTCLNLQMDAGCRCAAGRREAGRRRYWRGCSRHSRGETPNRCLKMRLKWARSLKPHAKAISPMCRAWMRGVGKIALAALQPLRLHVAAERGLFGGHQVAGVTRRDSCRRRGARQRQFGIGADASGYNS